MRSRRTIIAVLCLCVATTLTAQQSSVTADAHPVASPASPNVDVKTGDSTTSAFRVFNSTNTELLRVRSDGVIVLGGATGSQWDPAMSPAIEYKNTGIVFGDITDLHLVSNAYNPVGGWRYKTSGVAADYYLYNGGHGWRVAPAGTADGALTWLEAMRISNVGNVAIGPLPFVPLPLSVFGPPHLNGASRTVLGVYDSSSSGSSSNGGGIAFGGKFTAAGTPIAQEFASIEGFKENGGEGNYAGAMSFNTRVNGGWPTERVRIDSNGNVGIGTTAPAAKLHVNGDVFVSGNIAAKYQDLAEWVPSRDDLAPGTVVVLDPSANNGILASTTAYDTTVAGVVSAQPGIILGEAGAAKEQIATTGRVRVRVDASRGPITVGDLLVTSDKPGFAMRSDAIEIQGRKFHQPGTIIGKALEPLAGGEGEILVLLSLQ